MTEFARIERPKVAVTRKLLAPIEARMSELFDASLNDDDHEMTAEEIVALAQGCDVLVPTVTDRIDAALIEALPASVKLIANFGAGVNHIDLKAAKARGILVTNTPGVFTDDTADLTMALILNVPRRLGEGHRMMRSGEWKGWSPTGMLGHRVGGKTLGIVGMGKIGKALAGMGRAFNMPILYHNRQRLVREEEQKMQAEYVDLKTLLTRADFVSLNVPLTGQTRYLIGRNELALMKPEAFLINTARGPVVDEKALVEVLRAKKIAGAGLDVYEDEPALAPGLAELDNVVLLPHVGSGTLETRMRIGHLAVENLIAGLEGGVPPHLVNPEVLSRRRAG